MCPYCYIGKRRIEGALEQFEHKDAVEIEWKSFQLMPASLHRKMMIWLNIATKYQKRQTGAQEMMDSMTQNAKNSGFSF
jgi:protein disulfide-isomerase